MESGTVETSTTAVNGSNGIASEKPAERIEVLNPATGGVAGAVQAASAEAIATTVARVRANQAEWEAIGIAGRYHWLGKLRDWMLDNREQLADTLQAETGKVRGDIFLDLGYVSDLINFYGANAAKFLADESVRPHSPLVAAKKLVVRYRPHPVVGVISPWNFPLAMGLGDSIPALQAGAAVVIKPSEFTPLSLEEVITAWKQEIGAPDVFDCVHGTGEAGAALIDNVDCVQFTGSDRTGRKVMARAAETLTPVSLELGGKDPMIVLADADVDRAANAAAWGGMVNSGQLCISVERVYVEEPVYDEFVAKLTSEVAKLRQGADGRKPEKDVGAMTSPNQSAVVEDHVNDALANGARALTGGKKADGPGDYFEPTVLVDVDHSMKVMRDETFGPVVGVMKVRDSEQALELANDSRYGLAASVFGDKERAEKIARRVEAGSVNVNDVITNMAAMGVPMGGWKQSGIGYRHGAPGIKKYCRSESLVITRFAGKREPSWYPYTKGRRAFIDRLSQALNARDWRRRLGLRG
ncbi:MAG TPA: aldehyde dehydrogenase family protein [Solirubrobacterales bacterium]|nr:aldehyde dehydrogenase family protein [Solirubrobacterales bacterium]